MRRLNNRQNKTPQLAKPKKRRNVPRKPLAKRIGHHKKGPSRYPSM